MAARDILRRIATGLLLLLIAVLWLLGKLKQREDDGDE